MDLGSNSALSPGQKCSWKRVLLMSVMVQGAQITRLGYLLLGSGDKTCCWSEASTTAYRLVENAVAQSVLSKADHNASSVCRYVLLLG